MAMFGSTSDTRAKRNGFNKVRRNLILLVAALATLGLSSSAYAIFIWSLQFDAACACGVAPCPTGVSGALSLNPLTGNVTYDIQLEGLDNDDTIVNATLCGDVDAGVCNAGACTTVEVLEPDLNGTINLTPSEQTAMMAGDYIIVIETADGRIIIIIISKLPPIAMPAASTWGATALGLVILAIGTVVFHRRLRIAGEADAAS